MTRALRSRAVWLATAAALLFASCAAMGGEDGGGANLPDRGIAGWLPTAPDTAPWAIGSPTDPPTGGPSALVDGDALRVWYHLRAADQSFSIQHTSAPLAPLGLRPPSPLEAPLTALAPSFGTPTTVIASGRDPSVIRRPDGRYLMAHLDADGRLALAESADGLAFTPLPATGLPSDPVTSPSLVLEPRGLAVYVIADGSLLRYAEVSPLSFGAPVTVLMPGTDCLDLAGEPAPCWDETALVDAELRLATTPTGRTLWRLFYAGRRTSTAAIGFAASTDGLEFSRYAFNPVVSASFSATAPTTVMIGESYHLLYEEARNAATGGIVHLVALPAAASDRF